MLAADVVTPAADSFVRNNGFEQANFGDSPFLYVKTPGSGDSRVAFLKFDVSGWSAAEMGNATLYLAAALQTPTTAPITAAVFPVADSGWVEGNGTIAVRNQNGGFGGGSQLTGTSPGDGFNTDNNPTNEIDWANQPAIVGGPLAQAIVTRETFQTYAFDLTGYFQQQRAAGNNLVTVAIRNLEATDHQIRILSREFDGAGRPQLVISDPNNSERSSVRPAVSAADLVTGGGANHAITVVYTSPSPIDVSTIGPSDLTVTRDGGGALDIQSVTFDPPFNSTSITATYIIDAPGQTWDVTDNDLYTINVRRGEVRDVAGNESISSFNSFRAKAFDSTAPGATVNAAPITTGGAGTYSFTVTYADNIAFDVGTINTNNVSIATPNGGRITPTNVTFSANADDTQVVATYTIAAPGGDWGAEDNGAYSITLHTQSARDTAANEVPEFSTPLSVAIQGADTSNPTAAISAQDVITAGTANHAVTIVYTDDRGINAGSIGADDITVSTPSGGQLTVLSASTSPGGSGATQTTTYTIAPPAGGWSSAVNGQYTITLNSGAVVDTNGNAAPAATGTFSVAIAPPPPPDSVPPTASINAGNVTGEGGVIHAITIVFTDDIALSVGSFGPEDVTVVGPGGPVAVNGIQVNPPTDTTPVSVTYQVAAPGGTWDEADEGNYSITLNAGAVTDTSGNANAAVVAGFVVDTTGPDASGPSAAITVGNVTGPGGSEHQITVVYTDSGKVNVNSIDLSDISVMRADGLALAVTGRTFSPQNNGPIITAVYTVAAPGGAWDASDDGSYTITLAGGVVSDRKGNVNSGATATFSVNATVVDVTPPSATVVPVGPITTAGDTPVQITVTYSDNQPLPTSVFGADDLIVTGPNGPLVANTSVTVTPGANPNVVTATYQFLPPAGAWDVSDNGTYTVTLAPGAVTDVANNPAVLSAGSAFTVEVPAPTPIDPGFGSGNPIATNFVTEAIVAQPDGKLVLVGRRGIGGTSSSQGVIQRRNPDGTPDTSFGGGDAEVTTDAGVGATFYAVGLQKDGKIVVSGSMLDDFVLARYDTLGNLDPSFGAGGRALADFGAPGEAAYGLAVGPDDKIVVGGASADQFAFARYTAAGILDPTFGQGGKNLFDANGVDLIGAVALQRDGKILAAGASGANVVVIRLGVNGERDMSFAGDSILIVPGLLSREETGLFVDRSQAIAVQGDNKILVGNFTAAGRNFGVARVDQSGNLDPTFGTDGIATVDFGGNDDVDAILIQDTGEILTVGTTDAGGNPVTAVAAFNRQGKLITGFGAGGILTFNPAITTPGREIKIGNIVIRAFGTRQADGRLVIASSDRSPAPTSSSLVRLNVPGTRALPQGTLIGEFGNLTAGSRRGARFVDSVTGAIFTMKGGSGQAFRGDDGKINLVLTDGGGGITVVVKARGRVPLGDIVCLGTIRSMQVKTGDLSGTMFVGGMLGKLRIGNVAGTIAVNGAITSLLADSLTNAKILSGANLGADALLGGTNANADAFGVGVIGIIKVRGAIVTSIIGAGLNPVDGVIGNSDDAVTPGSSIRSIFAKSADETSRFYASTFGPVKLPKKIKDLAADNRFRTV